MTRVVVSLLLLVVLASPVHAQSFTITLNKAPHTLAFVRAVSPVSARCEQVNRETIDSFLANRLTPAVAEDGLIRDARGQSLQRELLFFGCAQPINLDTATPAVRLELEKVHADARRLQRGAFGATASGPTRASSDALPPESWEGAGSKTTDSFTATAPWRIVWAAGPAENRTGSLIVTVRDSAGDIVTTITSGRLTEARGDNSTVHKSGTFYLDILGLGVAWRVGVVQ